MYKYADFLHIIYDIKFSTEEKKNYETFISNSKFPKKIVS